MMQNIIKFGHNLVQLDFLIAFLHWQPKIFGKKIFFGFGQNSFGEPESLTKLFLVDARTKLHETFNPIQFCPFYHKFKQ